MPSDSNGVYSLPPGYVAVEGEIIQPSQHNPPLEDLAAGMNLRLLRSGVAPMLGPLDMAGSRIKNLPAPSEAGDAMSMSETENRYAKKAGDTFVGDVIIGKIEPALTWTYTAVASAKARVNAGGAWVMSNTTTGEDLFTLTLASGAVSTKQLGDLKTYIDTTSSSAANAAASGVANSSSAMYFDKSSGASQQVANGPSFNAGYIDVVRPGVLRGRIAVSADASIFFQNGDNNDTIAIMNSSSGAFWTKQIGDLNARIETRADAIASTRVNNKQCRWVFVADRDIADFTTGMFEGYGGSAVTGFATALDYGVYHVRVIRWRQLQMSDADQNWYAIGYT